jgi:hypothetical protein
MSRADKTAPVPSRPTLFDFILVVSGFGLSLVLSQAPTLQVTATPSAPPAAEQYLIPILPPLLRLTDGVVLLWPIFLLTQRLLGRKQGLTSGEWLWVVAWLVVAILNGLAWSQKWYTLPGFLSDHLSQVYMIGYLVVIPSMAAIAVVLILLSLIARWQQPWTHAFGLVLIAWPALPVAAVMTFTKIA